MPDTADAIAASVIEDVGPGRAVLHMAGHVLAAPTPRQSWRALILLWATIARACR